MNLKAYAHGVRKRVTGLIENLREGDVEAIKKKVYKRFARFQIPILSRYARFRLEPTAKERFLLDAMDELQVFLMTGSRLALPRSSDPRVTVLVILFNKAELTYLCLKSLASLQGDGELDILIIDNGSSDLTRELLRRVDGARIVLNAENVGFLRACNQSRDLVSAPYLLFLNNDTIVYPGSIATAVSALDNDATAGAVGARIILPDGTLQEAGSILWNDGTALGYGRGLQKSQSEGMFRRRVDYCSGAFLMTRTDLFKEIGGFDERYIPAYYEETDYCVMLHERGLHIVYDPRVSITHFEFGSSVMSERTMALMATNAVKFRAKHAEWLATKHPPGTNPHAARSSHRTGPRILMVDDRVPHVYWGAGFPRTNRIVELLHELGYEITIYCTDKPDSEWSKVYADIPTDVEVILGGTLAGLNDLLRGRRGLFDIVWVSRPNNFRHLYDNGRPLWESRDYCLVYDAEAIFSERDALEQKITGRNVYKVTRRTLESEMAMGGIADLIVSVTASEAQTWSARTGKPSLVIGHDASPDPCSEGFDERCDILFLGSMHGPTSPNTDSLIWFFQEAYAPLKAQLGADVRVRAVGFVAPEARRELAARCPELEIIGMVDDLRPYLARHRIMIVPTRFAAGIPQKVFDAAVTGLPTVCSNLIAAQMGWKDGVETLAAPTEGGSVFAARCAALYSDKALWEAVRAASLDSMRGYQTAGGIAKQLDVALAAIATIRSTRADARQP